MKKHNPSELSSEVWQQIEFIFWRNELSCLPSDFTGDGIEPISIKTTKRGIEIEGRIWFLPEGCYDLHLCLARPHFTNISSVTPERVTDVVVTEASLDRKTLRVTAGVPGASGCFRSGRYGSCTDTMTTSTGPTQGEDGAGNSHRADQ
jgi:hypothetical protein